MNNKEMQEFLSPPNILNAKKVLCIQPHPDDNEIGMGATIKTLSTQGTEIDYLTVTDGRLGTTDENMEPNQLVKIRKSEAEIAGKLLGCKNFFYFDYKDASLTDIPELAKKIATLIRQNHYDFIFVPDPYNAYEAHNDHIVVGKAAAQAVISSYLAHYPENTETKPWAVKGIGFYFTAAPNSIVDIKDNFDIKFKAIAIHKSQMDPQTLSIFKIYFEKKSEELGKKIGTRRAEDFKVLSPLLLHCFPEANSI